MLLHDTFFVFFFLWAQVAMIKVPAVKGLSKDFEKDIVINS